MQRSAARHFVIGTLGATALITATAGASNAEHRRPSTTVPATTVPNTTVPNTTVPNTTVPPTTVPPTTVPPTTVAGTSRTMTCVAANPIQPRARLRLTGLLAADGGLSSVQYSFWYTNSPTVYGAVVQPVRTAKTPLDPAYPNVWRVNITTAQFAAALDTLELPDTTSATTGFAIETVAPDGSHWPNPSWRFACTLA